jgi:hypothetical protein
MTVGKFCAITSKISLKLLAEVKFEKRISESETIYQKIIWRYHRIIFDGRKDCDSFSYRKNAIYRPYNIPYNIIFGDCSIIFYHGKCQCPCIIKKVNSF